MKRTAKNLALAAIVALGIGSYSLYKGAEKKNDVRELVASMSAAQTESNASVKKGLEDKIKRLDEKIDEIDLTKSPFLIDAALKKFGYVYGIFNEKPYLMKIAYKDDDRVFYCNEHDSNFRGIAPCGANYKLMCLNRWGEVIVDLNSFGKDADKIEKGWKEIEKNNEYFRNKDKRWNPSLQIYYNLFKNSKNKADDYLNLAIKEGVIHEKQHISDHSTGRYGIKDQETRALLKELMDSPLALSSIEFLSKSETIKDYNCAAKIILNKLQGNMKSKRDLYNMPNEEISKKAKDLFEKQYKN